MLFGKLSYEMELQILIHQQVLYEIGEELSVWSQSPRHSQSI